MSDIIDPEKLDQVYEPVNELAQRGPVGGADECGHEIELAPVPVQVVNIADVRTTASLLRTSGKIPLGVNEPARVVGRTLQRQRLVLCSSVTVTLCDNEAQAAGGQGLILPAETFHEVRDVGDVWAVAAVAGEISYWHEMDAG